MATAIQSSVDRVINGTSDLMSSKPLQSMKQTVVKDAINGGGRNGTKTEAPAGTTEASPLLSTPMSDDIIPATTKHSSKNTASILNGPVSGIPSYPITLEHPPPKDLDKVMPNPGMPRANKAVSREKPEGDPRSPADRTVLQQHVMFWDRDNDGVIFPYDTFVGFRRLGFNLLISSLAVPFIHLSFSYPTLKSWIPDPRLPIYLNQIHRTKHGSDSEVYDTEGRFVPEKFESIFSKFDKDNKGGLGWKDIQEMVYTNMNINDPNGWIAERLEWYVTYLLLRDHKGLVSKEKIRGVYDGTIWEVVAQQEEERKQRARAWRSSKLD
ncbi:hypothetical protein HYH03_009647 [Edaphochlamys debaryana]|uniref:EF-hand domain-containing protein n=1 Tax=Edaphochlamys debaryana TaxID=47281 RepID=A0A835Y138_9CHLO|nr:hypothetical protein HYH03_009647 [Edaphochlamys debaryana]|eukprot:KAG2492156.1 hypothetical protein HYH03_009647 [Edaphochlamys debaryana]